MNWLFSLILLAIGAAAGWSQGRAPLAVELANTKATYAAEQRQTAENNRELLRLATKRGDLLSEQLDNQQLAITTLSKEKHDAIRQATTGRTCFDSYALRVLNGSPGLRVSGFPATTGAPAAADGAAAADSGATWVSTDTDIGDWAITAGAQFETCRSRLNALIDWHVSQPDAKGAAQQ